MLCHFNTAAGLGAGLALRNSSSSPSSSGTYQHAAVATDAPQCSKVGVDVLRKNGSAVDAAIASLLCVGVVNLHSTGIGGGGFMLYYNATSGNTTVFDFRETAPLLGSKYMYNGTAEGSTTRGELISRVTASMGQHCYPELCSLCRWTSCCCAWGAERTRDGMEEVWFSSLG